MTATFGGWESGPEDLGFCSFLSSNSCWLLPATSDRLLCCQARRGSWLCFHSSVCGLPGRSCAAFLPLFGQQDSGSWLALSCRGLSLTSLRRLPAVIEVAVCAPPSALRAQSSPLLCCQSLKAWARAISRAACGGLDIGVKTPWQHARRGESKGKQEGG